MVVINEKDYVTVTEFAHAINKAWSTVDNYVRKGILIPDIVIGKHRYFLPEQVEQFKKGNIIPYKKEEI